MPLCERVRKWRAPVLMAALPCAVPVGAAAGDAAPGWEAQVLLFPSLTWVARTGAEVPAAGLPRKEATPAASLFVRGGRGRLRFLLEAAATDESASLERLKLGWETTRLAVWAGRFHNPATYWHDRYHHGEYVQPSISHPPIAAFEEGGGVLPQHLVGGLARARLPAGRRGLWELSLAAGRGPALGDGRLEPLHLTDLGRRRQGSSLVARLGWRPDELGDAEAGLVAARHRVPLAVPGAGTARVTVLGLYGAWSGAEWEVTGKAVRMRTALAGRRGRVTAAYLHVGRALGPQWLLYGRRDLASGLGGDPYLGRFPHFPGHGGALGLRWDFARGHALKLELARHRDGGGRTLRMWGLQWSAVLP